MATTVQKNTFSTTYKDDFKDSDNFYRILFNAGRALQARELTQSQTIIQKEIERFGSNIFKEGGVVRSGNVTLNTRAEFIKLDALPSGVSITDLPGKVLTSTDAAAIKVEVLEAIAASGSDPVTIYVKYLDTSSGTASTSPVRVSNATQLQNATLSGNLTVASSAATGRGTKISVDNGDYFVQGHFVFVDRQSIFVNKYSSTPSEIIGFKIVEEVVNTDDNTALFDNQGAVPNIAAPGADRYRIRLVLTKKSDITASDNFVYLMKIVNGVIVDESSSDDAYNRINDLLALRTKEESGDYVVEPFTAKFDNLNDSNLELDVSSGVAYVDGYRLDIPTKKITVPKARDTITLSNEVVIAQYGNYVIGNASTNKGLPNVTTNELVDLRSAATYGGSTIGTARVRAVEEDSGSNNYRYYLIDIQMNAGSSFSSVRSFGTSVTNYTDIVLEGGNAVLKETSNNSLLFKLPNENPTETGIGTTSLVVQRRYTFSNQSSGVKSLGVQDPSEYDDGQFTQLSDFIISEIDSAINGTHATPTFTGGGDSVTISNLVDGKSYELIAYATITGTHSVKSKQTTSVTKLWPDSADSDGNGVKYIDLGQPDIFTVTSITADSANGPSLASNFTVDNGQRDNFYALGRVIEKGGTSIPSGQIRVGFTHFNISTQGDYFSARSYNPTISYDSIPSHRKNDGEIVSLRDVLDFRPYQTSAGAYNTTAGYHHLPQTTGAITAGTVVYYLPRSDRLVASVTNSRDGRIGVGDVKVVRGVSSTNPELPEIPTGSIPLYDINLNAYTFSPTDLTTSVYDNRRFTMKDISRLERRIDDLKELTTLSLLETNTSTLTVVDSAGLERTKAGFIADAFSNYDFSDTDRDEYRAAIDATENVLSPEIWPNNVRLFFDSATSYSANGNKGSRKGDLLMLPIDSNVSIINQDLATEALNVNPFAVITQLGHTDLSPASDTWVEIKYDPDRIIDGGTVTRNVGRRRVRNLDAWRGSWFGQNQSANNTQQRVIDGIQVVTGSRVIRRTVGERVLDIEILPFMRSVKVEFRSQGLRPKTRYFPYFGGIAIDDFTRQNSGNAFTRFASNNSSNGNLYTNATAHPDGSTNLFSDSAGTLTGSFIIPSTNSLRFRTGRQQFKLLDISANNDNDAVSRSAATFTSSGVLETRQRTVRSTRVLDIATIVERELRSDDNDRDPLAQSFRIDQFENPNGLFLSKARVYFKTKSTTGVPVQVQIRTVENGVPTGIPLPGAVKFLSPSEVNVPSDLTENDGLIGRIRSAGTDFEFDEPVFLASGVQYAIVILAESTEYQAYVAKTYDFVIGTTASRIAKQPTLGSLFLSQNSTTWTPDQERDLMFQLFRAQFASSSTITANNAPMPNYLLETDPFQMDSGSAVIKVFHDGHGFSKNDKVDISGLTAGTRYAGILGSSLNGTRDVANVDHTGFTFTADSSATATIRTGGTTATVSQNAIINSFFPMVTNILPESTTLSTGIKLTGGDLSYAGARNTGPTFTKDTGFTTISLNELNFTENPKVILSDSNETTRISGAKSLTMQFTLGTTDDRVSPVLDFQRASITTFENVIDKQDSAATSGFNVPLSFVAETHPTDGSSAAKHITKIVTLEEPAVGLKILFAANRPSTADFEVYYKIGTADEVLDDKNWVYIEKESTVPADNIRGVFREYEYLAGGRVGNLDNFTQYQVKIVMNTTNSSKEPRIKDLRAIALVT